MWRRKLIVGIVAIVFVIGGLVMVHETGKSHFCGSCHEMKYIYRTWELSSHQDAPCSACHYDTGLLGMVKTKLQGAREGLIHLQDRPDPGEILPGIAEVPSERCLKCHESPTLPGELTYHLLFHTHAKHLERGAECTDCHANVVHGGKAPFKNTPTMSRCLSCHDGEQAPNRCGLCHLKLGEIKPPLYNPEWIAHHKENLEVTGEETCRKCHADDFCNSCHAVGRPVSHGGDWVYSHETIEPTERESCNECHEPRGDRPEADFCVECHEARSAHGPGYITSHPDEFQQEPDACGRCHDQTFCQDCHTRYMPHDPGWLVEHGPQSQGDRDNCRICHTDQYCTQCHTSGRPKSHTADYRRTHPALAKADAASCRTCHPTNFCQQCHKESLPQTHQADNWLRAHGGTALASRDACRACHDASYCESCHRGVRMPHPGGWVKSHPRSSPNARSCTLCHEQDFCNACHRGSKPDSHTGTWPNTHGKTAETSRSSCLRCHTERYCDTCHRLPMPHPSDIGTSHGSLALEPEGRYCGLCHVSDQCATCHAHKPPSSHADAEWRKRHGAAQGADSRCVLCHEADTCRKCHGVEIPHPEGWMLELHGASAEAKPKACASCHDTDYCGTCHESTPPSSHEANSFKKKHGSKPEREPLCLLCHGRDEAAERNVCDTCHGGLQMPHPERFALEHKPIGSFDQEGPCLHCHEIDHCKMCHAKIPDDAR